MANGARQVKSTGYIPPTQAESASAEALPKSTAKAQEALPVSTAAPLPAESLSSVVEVSPSNILAIAIMLGDYTALKKELPASRLTSNNGKIYWCAEMPGHTLALVDGELLVDGVSANELLEKLLAVK